MPSSFRAPRLFLMAGLSALPLTACSDDSRTPSSAGSGPLVIESAPRVAVSSESLTPPSGTRATAPGHSAPAPAAAAPAATAVPVTPASTYPASTYMEPPAATPSAPSYTAPTSSSALGAARSGTSQPPVPRQR